MAAFQSSSATSGWQAQKQDGVLELQRFVNIRASEQVSKGQYASIAVVLLCLSPQFEVTPVLEEHQGITELVLGCQGLLTITSPVPSRRDRGAKAPCLLYLALQSALRASHVSAYWTL